MEEKIETQPEVEQTEAELPSPSFWQKLKANKFKILGGILGILVFAGTVFGAYKFGRRQVQPGPQPTPSPAVVATPTPDPTANWKTYTNTKYGYSIKYPNKWQALEVKEGPEVGIRIDFAGSESFSEREYWIWTKVNNNPDGLSAKQWVDRLLLQYSDQPAVMAGIKREKDRLADAEAERVTGLPAMTEIVSVFIPKEKSMYEIVLQKGIGALSGESQDLFNLMLSTFRFLEGEVDIKSQGECESLGGKWTYHRAHALDPKFAYCVLPTSDAGRSCTNNSQCENGLCVVESQDSTSGTCYGWSSAIGWCGLVLVEENRVKSYCID